MDRFPGELRRHCAGICGRSREIQGSSQCLMKTGRISLLPTEKLGAQKDRTASRPRLAAAANAPGRPNLIRPAPAIARAASRGRLAVRWCCQVAPTKICLRALLAATLTAVLPCGTIAAGP